MLTNVVYLAQRMDELDYDSILVRVSCGSLMDINNSGKILIFLKTLISGGVKKIVIDMMGLEYIDSSGISVLIEMAKFIRKKNGDIALSNVPQWIQKILEPFKLHSFINIFSSHDDAVRFFKLH